MKILLLLMAFGLFGWGALLSMVAKTSIHEIYAGLTLHAGLLAFVGAAIVEAVNRSQTASEGQETPETHVRCPECRELVRKDAKRCKHCHTILAPQ